jgi:hypothetical protein
MGKLLQDKNYFKRFIYIDPGQCQLSASSDKDCSPCLREKRTPLQMEISVLLLGRQREVKELFLHLWFLNCLHLKIILKLKWYILEWLVMVPFIGLAT